MFPDEPVPEIAGPEMATCLRAFWECCWAHGIDPRNPGEGLAALEARNAAERQALLRYAPREVSSGFARTRNNPDEGTGGLVVIRDEGVDVLDEFGTAPEGLTIERLFGEDREPDFDLV
jgi:hypothetical protein